MKKKSLPVLLWCSSLVISATVLGDPITLTFDGVTTDFQAVETSPAQPPVPFDPVFEGLQIPAGTPFHGVLTYDPQISFPGPQPGFLFFPSYSWDIKVGDLEIHPGQKLFSFNGTEFFDSEPDYTFHGQNIQSSGGLIHVNLAEGGHVTVASDGFLIGGDHFFSVVWNGIVADPVPETGGSGFGWLLVAVTILAAYKARVPT